MTVEGVDLATIGIFTPTTGTFALRNTNTPGAANLFFGFGSANPNLIPLAGDWDGNGTRTPGLYDPATRTFFLRNTNSSGNADTVFKLGPQAASNKPVAGNFDGN